jgi:hypothetical protein
MQERVSSWWRAGMVVLAVPQLAIGIWAMVAPHHWYENFPGVHPHLISAEPPYNASRHRRGIGFFATGVGLVLAAHSRADRVCIALVTFPFAGPHPLPRCTEGLTGSEDVSEVLFLCRQSSSLACCCGVHDVSTRHPIRAVRVLRTPRAIRRAFDQLIV